MTDRERVQELAHGALASLERNRQRIDDLNVYPVPDGDTGTNMLHTMRAAVKHARDAEPRIDKVSTAAAYGALMGARGNSGVILSQVIRGLKEAFAGKETAGVADDGQALTPEVDTATCPLRIEPQPGGSATAQRPQDVGCADISGADGADIALAGEQ